MARHITSFPALRPGCAAGDRGFAQWRPEPGCRACARQQPAEMSKGVSPTCSMQSKMPAIRQTPLKVCCFPAISVRGKSHLLADLEHLALDRNFVCSRVPISKETPFIRFGQGIFIGYGKTVRVPDRGGRLVEELARSIKPHSEKYIELFQWAFRAARDGSLHSVFPASLSIYEHAMNLDLNGDIEAFWAGSKIGCIQDTRGTQGD